MSCGRAPAGAEATTGGRADVAGLPRSLPAVSEPVALRDAWWAAERAGVTPPDLVEAATGAVWKAWAGSLAGTAGSGVDPGWLAQVVAGYRRELWLWLVGERTWEQCLSGLAGRVDRRLPT